MRLPVAQDTALNLVQSGLSDGWCIEVFKWGKPTHLHGYRVETITVRDVGTGALAGYFEASSPRGLLICTTYERLVMSLYDDDDELVFNGWARRVIEHINQAVLSTEKDDRHVLLFGNVIDGIHMVGPFESVEDATDWADNHARGDEYHVATIKHPEA
ncbi:hypothetical protein PJWF_00105 [Achromobacter phage JWF]|uniref:hypothetical protein n=1 Tax=Achromobacter phage JWF TaxID=1589748 RepID=UPI000588E5E9|nr:hypothetical protein AXJ13_gp083 [Achromobacter phage JWF]AJD82998.1 hypothetical protein PJWF_00105 [Achromobacter phage JWF]